MPVELFKSRSHKISQCVGVKSRDVSVSTFCDGSSQGCLAVINVADCSNVDVGFFSGVCLLSLCNKGSPTQGHSSLHDKARSYTVAKPMINSLYIAVCGHTHQFEGAVQEARRRQLKS